jgi:tRNA A-37 threonylcarbamoyl transferase component Bud32/tetratricopeptide (TPR) repeat protein
MISEESSGGICRRCGAPLRGGEPLGGHCLACLLEAAIEEEKEPGAGIDLFDHYQLLRHADGTPVELGRGAMGITYKAIDVHLRCDVTLKVIRGKYLGEESARLRFLREARAAASVRHPNVASVFHLGRTGENYFYAMEFVEGETLASFLKRSGRLEIRTALEISRQVTTGLAAVHKQKLVHRDIKPSNIMVNFEEEGAVTAKIIDLGLAKAVNPPTAQTAISTFGHFAGTPEYASPEQFGGIGVDIRSDLYSLGVLLWEMLTGNSPFRGSPAELMHQHQHAALPLEQLQGVPQPLVSLIERLLNKDPGERLQSPTELLKALPTITRATEEGQTITYGSLGSMRAGDLRVSARRGPEKISVARLPVTGSDLFGREEDLAFLDDAWARESVNIVTVVAWAGVGKSTLVNHWLRRLAAEHYRAAELVFGWSFYRQGTSETSSADEFTDAALDWFGDPDPTKGTAWEKGERLAKLIVHRRTLLILDGLEPLQNPPGPQEGRLRDPFLQALLKELAAFNTGLCLITTRLPIIDIADHEHGSAWRRDLEQLSSDAGGELLRAMGVKGEEAELRSASDEFGGHCLALTLLGSYLTNAYNGDIRCRKEVSERLTSDVRQGVHARKVMESYQSWFGEGPELSVLRMLGLFDRPADGRAIETLVKPPAIPGLTESLTNLRPEEWRSILAKLRRAKLLAGEDPHNRGQLDAHPLVREYFGEQLRSQQAEAWKECNRRLYHYYKMLAPQLPESFSEMEPLFLAAISGCRAGLFREVLHEVYIPRIQRGKESFAAKVLGAREPLLSVLAHFFEDERWGSPVKTAVKEQSLTEEDQLFILLQAAQYLTAMRGMGSADPRICYERAQPLCQSLNRPDLLYVALVGQWRYFFQTDNLTTTMQIAERVYSLAQGQNDPALMIGGCRAVAGTLFFLGDFESARRYATEGVRVWRSASLQSAAEEYYSPLLSCLRYEALAEWQLGETVSSRASLDEAISIARDSNDMIALAFALNTATSFAVDERNPAEVDYLASKVTELSLRYHFVDFLAEAAIYRGWARSVSGDTTEGIGWIEDGMSDFRATGAVLGLTYLLALQAEALHLADRTSEALQTIEEAEAIVQRTNERQHLAELNRLRGVFLAAIGGDQTRVETLFSEAIRIAKEQKSVWLEKRAQATYAEYRHHKASTLASTKLRLQL